MDNEEIVCMIYVCVHVHASMYVRMRIVYVVCGCCTYKLVVVCVYSICACIWSSVCACMHVWCVGVVQVFGIHNIPVCSLSYCVCMLHMWCVVACTLTSVCVVCIVCMCRHALCGRAEVCAGEYRGCTRHVQTMLRYVLWNVLNVSGD